MDWIAPQRPVEYAEQALVTAILNGTYAAGDTLPGERDLAGQLGVTRPTLREVLRRLEREGWLTVRQGKATTVNNIWRDGGLNLLGTLVRYADELPPNFIVNLLQVRLDLAPTYTRAAAARAADQLTDLLAKGADLPDEPAAFATFDWRLHRRLTTASGNPIYTLILNGFAGFYEQVAQNYFAHPEARARSRRFYASLLAAVHQGDLDQVESLARQAMRDSMADWAAREGG